MSDNEQTLTEQLDDESLIMRNLNELDAGEKLAEILDNLNNTERKYAQARILQRKSRSEAMKLAGSKATHKSRMRMGHEMEQKKEVLDYMRYLEESITETLGIQMQEVVDNARKCIAMAMKQKKPKDAEPHNRLLAELGGFIRGNSSSPTANAQQTNVSISVGEALKTKDNADDSLKDLKALLTNVGGTPKNLQHSPDEDMNTVLDHDVILEGGAIKD